MCPDRDDERDRDDRPSWREIDKMREQSAHRKEKPEFTKASPKEQASIRKEALNQAGALFSKKLSPRAQKALDELLDLQGQPNFEEKAKAYVDRYGLPDQWRYLLLMLDVHDPELFEQALSMMQEIYKEQPISNRAALKSKLSILSMTAPNGRIQGIARRIKSKL